MPTTPTTPTKPSAIVEIERLGFTYTEVGQFDLTRLDESRRVQVRETKHYASREAVEQYAVAMGQTEFPPVVITSDDYIVDGHTRIAASLLRKNKFFPAIVLDAAWRGANTKTQNELYALAATLNQQGGVRLTGKEVRDVASRLVLLGWKTEQIGRAIGLKAASVTQVKREIDAAAKLRRVGLDPNGAMRGASLRALGTKDVLALNDVPFKELATLSADAGLNAGEITGLAKEMKETGSDESAIDRVHAVRTELGDRIKDQELTGASKPPVSRQLRQHLGFVTKFEGREQELIETNPEVGGAHIEALTKAIAVLTAVLEMQR
jgi:hypothetical protein